MDESMDSIHSISAMDISPAYSPQSPLARIPSNQLLLNAFQQQQELLSNILSEQSISDYHRFNSKHPLSEDYNPNGTSFPLFSTAPTENMNEEFSKFETDASNQVRRRNPPDSAATTVETIPSVVKPKSSSCGSLCRIFIFVVLLLSIIWIIFIPKATLVTQLETSTWRNASEYLMKNLIGQERGLEEFNEIMEKHENFTVVVIESSIGTGKSYLAASLEKFIRTTLLSANTLLGLSAHHWTDSDSFSTYLLSSLSPSLFQFLIIDDLDLLPNDMKYCKTLATAFHSISNRKNIVILLLHTGAISSTCKGELESLSPKHIHFNMLQRHHVRQCIENEAYLQNVQPPFDDQQIENILNSLQYTIERGIAYSTTGCKQIPSLVILESKKH